MFLRSRQLVDARPRRMLYAPRHHAVTNVTLGHLPRQLASVFAASLSRRAKAFFFSGFARLECVCEGEGEARLLFLISGNQELFVGNKLMVRSGLPRWRGLHRCLLLVCALVLFRGANGSESVGLPVLRVGEERNRETLAFFDGSRREYEVQGLQECKWFEIKISYPASIPASINIKFRQRSSEYKRRAGRRLLNIEKTMFYVSEGFSEQAKTAGPWGRATVEVHPAGVISKHLSSDHPLIIYNILCEEVILGIPKQAWWVGCLAALVIYSAFHISARLPSTLIPGNSRVAKDSKEAE